MLYLVIGILVFLYFRKKFDSPIIDGKSTFYNLIAMVYIIVFWPLMVFLEILDKLRGIK